MRKTFLGWLVCFGVVFVGFAMPSSGAERGSGKRADQQSRIGTALALILKDVAKPTDDRKLLHMVLLLQQKQPGNVIEFYKANFSQEKPGSLLIQMALVQALEAKESHDAAHRILSSLAKTHNASAIEARAFYQWGISFHRKGEEGLDEGCLYDAIKLDPTYAPAYYKLADWSKDRQDTINYCAATLALVSPDAPLAKEALALLLDVLEKKE